VKDCPTIVGGSGGGKAATFPAYGEGEEGTAALIPTAGANTSIVHPTHDISLVSVGNREGRRGGGTRGMVRRIRIDVADRNRNFLPERNRNLLTDLNGTGTVIKWNHKKVLTDTD
jgi:hypothetical protein